MALKTPKESMTQTIITICHGYFILSLLFGMVPSRSQDGPFFLKWPISGTNDRVQMSLRDSKTMESLYDIAI